MRNRIKYKQSAKAWQAVASYYEENFNQFQKEMSKHHNKVEVNSKKTKLNSFEDLSSIKDKTLKSLIGKSYMLFRKKHIIKTLKEAETVMSLNYNII